MIKHLIILGTALAAHVAWANVRFPTDGKLEAGFQSDQVAAQIKLPVVIAVRPVGQVAAPRIYLHDIATCSGPPVACAEVLSIDIDESAQPGKTKTIALDRIQLLLGQEAGPYHVKIEGSPTTRVASKYVEITPREVQDALQAVLLSRIQNNKHLRLRSLNIQMARPIKAWPGEFRLLFPLVQDAQMHHMDWVVEHLLGDKSWTLIYDPLNFEANRREVHRITVHVELEIELPVARANIPRGTLLQHADFEYKWIRAGRQSLGLVQEVKNIVGLLTKQAVRSGYPVTYRMLEVPEVVVRGEKVKMLIKKSGLNVTAEGKALKSGGVGQVIAVYYPATKKTVQGVVTSMGAVEVQL